jgi:hypothetical protein
MKPLKAVTDSIIIPFLRVATITVFVGGWRQSTVSRSLPSPGRGRGRFGGQRFSREILTEADRNRYLNHDPDRFNGIHFSRGKWPTFFTSLIFIHPAIGRLTRMRRVRAADRPGPAPRDPFLIQDAFVCCS